VGEFVRGTGDRSQRRKTGWGCGSIGPDETATVRGAKRGKPQQLEIYYKWTTT